MKKTESRYFATAAKMDEALIECLEKKDLPYITVKEICEKAGVNRSTFYLHYENIGDLLEECVEYTNNRCFEQYGEELADVSGRLRRGRPEELVFISPEYLRPYLRFVKENRRLYRVVLQHQELFHTKKTFSEIFDRVFSPALDSHGVPEREKAYTALFYLGGITSVVCEWLARDCEENVEEIVGVCMRIRG